MKLLVSGATGFVMSVVGRAWLEFDPAATLIALDAQPLDACAERYFAFARDRVTVVTADVTRPETWADSIDRRGVTHVVHGATITPISRGTVAESQRNPEAEMPRRIIDVNVMGTVAMLDWARTIASLQRFLYVSSGGVYKEHGPEQPGEALPEDGYVMPRYLYGISKLSSELITERYGQLFGFSTVSMRPSSVFGPMDRVRPTRSYRCVPNRIAHAAVDGVKRIRVNTLDAVGDYIHAEDVATATLSLLHAQQLHHSVYNVATGVPTSIRELVSWAAEKVPGFGADVVSPDQADVVQDASLNSGMWGAYDIARIRAETGWTPGSVHDRLHAYMDWIATQRRVRS
jgi:nucleoside-diphosphate-sugar epimerase